MRRALAIPVLLLVFTWPMESAIAAVAMRSAHDCCRPKAEPACHEHAGHSGSTLKISASHSHEQCPMDCCSKRQASSSAFTQTAAQVRAVATQSLQVTVHTREAHESLQFGAQGERAPPYLL